MPWLSYNFPNTCYSWDLSRLTQRGFLQNRGESQKKRNQLIKTSIGFNRGRFTGGDTEEVEKTWGGMGVFNCLKYLDTKKAKFQRKFQSTFFSWVLFINWKASEPRRSGTEGTS